MPRATTISICVFAAAALGGACTFAQPLGVGPAPAIALNSAVGGWSISFSNGVVEACYVGADGAARVEEPLRRSPGRAQGDDDSFVIAFEDDRTERWTRVGGKMVVEHWCPSAAFPDGPRVLGIAERAMTP